MRDNPEVNKTISAMTALGRPWVPDDVGPMIAALLSDENRWVKLRESKSPAGCRSDLELYDPLKLDKESPMQSQAARLALIRRQ